MRDRVLGYWTLAWVGLIGNIIALPIIALIVSYGPSLKVANITPVSYTHLTLPTSDLV